ncbi:conjugal transfer protein TraM [Methylobacter psychrophilus]|uniref:conjugal transfer protein TraM n=1 Tax=Methylobacter psychrophilus TaxID=96941 RepID=UPI0021D48E43|nr:conjugal transfer protein TraM [Methylobacter psychrophilus]
MSEENDALLKEIAVKHGIAVGRDDPILILQTINNKLMQDSQKAQQDLLDQFKAELEGLSLRWSTDAKEKAERILNVSLCASKESMEQLMQATAKELVATIKKEVTASLSVINRPVRDAYRISAMNILAACLTIFAAAILLWTATHF